MVGHHQRHPVWPIADEQRPAAAWDITPKKSFIEEPAHFGGPKGSRMAPLRRRVVGDTVGGSLQGPLPGPQAWHVADQAAGPRWTLVLARPLFRFRSSRQQTPIPVGGPPCGVGVPLSSPFCGFYYPFSTHPATNRGPFRIRVLPSDRFPEGPERAQSPFRFPFPREDPDRQPFVDHNQKNYLDRCLKTGPAPCS